MAALLSRDCQIGLMGPNLAMSILMAKQIMQLTSVNSQRDGSFIVGREPIKTSL